MKYWLVKTEAAVFSIDDLKQQKNTLWDGVRNYQARNFLKSMGKGDKVLIYHSNSEPTGFVGTAVVFEIAVPDPSQFDKKSEYFYPKATIEKPIWFSPMLKFTSKLKTCVTRDILMNHNQLKNMGVMKKGNRLSVMEVTPNEYDAIVKIGS
jgi:predicted RNA-binding protein with PUA-like domain